MTDLLVREEQGKAIALWLMCLLLDSVVGPVTGEFLFASFGWIWVFWVLGMTIT